MSACAVTSTRTPITATASWDCGWSPTAWGHACGEVASALARETIVREVRAGTPLAQAVRIADEEIIKTSRRCNDTLPMGTTVVAARVLGQRFEVAWLATAAPTCGAMAGWRS